MSNRYHGGRDLRLECVDPSHDHRSRTGPRQHGVRRFALEANAKRAYHQMRLRGCTPVLQRFLEDDRGYRTSQTEQVLP